MYDGARTSVPSVSLEGVERSSSLLAPEGDDAGAQAGVWGEDAVVAVAVDAWGWNEASEGGEEFERGEHEQFAAVGRGPRRPVEDLPHKAGVAAGLVASVARSVCGWLGFGRFSTGMTQRRRL